MEGKECVIFEGTADSVRKSAGKIDKYPLEIILVLGSDHVYLMSYNSMIAQHIETGADMTIMVNAVPESRFRDLGIVKVDPRGRIIDFTEKPQDQAAIEDFRLNPQTMTSLGINNPQYQFLASTGNYVFYWKRLRGYLHDIPGSDWGDHLIPGIQESGGRIFAHVFSGYWRDVGKIEDYFACNLEFAQEDPPLDLHAHRLRTYERHLPGARIATSVRWQNVILSDGVIIQKGCILQNVVLGYQVVLESGVHLDRCVFLGADRDEFYQDQRIRSYTTRIGQNSRLRNVIFDKNIWLPGDVEIGYRDLSLSSRVRSLEEAGLKPYRENPDGTKEGDFYIEPVTNILVLGKVTSHDPKEPLLPPGFIC